MGKGVLKAVKNVESMLLPALKGMDPTQQEAIDNKMKEVDGTDNKSSVGAVRIPPFLPFPANFHLFPPRLYD
jgi:enolase